jgi:hydrogenase maturation protease
MSRRARQGNQKSTRQADCCDRLQPPGLPVAWSTLVIGYGNDLRGDDAAGQRVAQEVAAWSLPSVRVLAMHQLAPELAEDLAHAHNAIFVDAYRADAGEANVYVRPIAPCRSCELLGHSGDPAALLALAQAIYGRCPRAYLIAVPAVSCEYGADLSDVTKAGVTRALYLLRALVLSARGVLCTKSDCCRKC